MSMLNKSAFLWFMFIQVANVLAQPMPEKISTLLFPIQPGTQNTLAGTMGELRSSHFHTGIDIRTEGQEGKQVFAADEGYIFRISVKPGGYGNALYIKHPNGHTTVYAHLQSFTNKVADYVRKQQYQKKKFAIEVFPEASVFKVNKGDLIALSGNSGSSGGPHLHFDVRNRNQDLLNPLHYGFKEVRDTRAPQANKLALVTSTLASRVSGEYGRLEFPIENNGVSYYIKDTLRAIGRIGVELLAYDRMNHTRFRTGINQIDLRVNNTLKMRTSIETWPFSKARQFYTYINYEALALRGNRYHKLYIDEGNHLNFYNNPTDKGYLTIKEGEIYTIDITMSDSYLNESKLHFVVKGEDNSNPKGINSVIPKGNWRIYKNTLVIKTNAGDTCSVYIKGQKQQLRPSFESDGNSIFLWQLSKGIADSLLINDSTVPLSIQALVPAGVDYKLYNRIADLQFSKRSLFANMYITMTHHIDSISNTDVIEIGDLSVPLNSSISVIFKPDRIPAETKFTRVYSIWGDNADYIGGNWKGDRITFSTRSFGTFTLLTDSLPPKVKPLILNKNEMVFKITDNLSGIGTFEMRLNNEWVLMNYDPKKSLIWAEKPNEDFVFAGNLKLRVTDNTNNETIYSTELR